MLKRILVLLLALPVLAYAAPPSFSLTDTQGHIHTLATHQGKWVLVNLWAT